MCPCCKTRQLLGTLGNMQLLTKGMKESGCPAPVFREYFSDSPTIPTMPHPIQTSGCKWTETIFPYQLCSTISNQRHKRYLIQASSNAMEGFAVAIEFSRLMSTIDTSKGGPVMESGGRLGKLDSATESGMFHKVNKAKLEQLKKTLKDNPPVDKKNATPDPATKSEE